LGIVACDGRNLSHLLETLKREETNQLVQEFCDRGGFQQGSDTSYLIHENSSADVHVERNNAM
jgi:hypothetical protein